jgi:hypothetical protein
MSLSPRCHGLPLERKSQGHTEIIRRAFPIWIFGESLTVNGIDQERELILKADDAPLGFWPVNG